MTPEERAEQDRIAEEAEAERRRERGDELDPDQQAAANLSEEDLAAVAAEGQVPYARLRESQDQARIDREERIRLEAENRILRERGAAPATPPEPPVDLKALKKQYAEAILEGDTDKAAEIDEQIDEIKEARITQRVVGATREDTANRELAATAEAIVRDYPFLDSQGPEANKEAIAETLEWRDFYIQKGKSPAVALAKAVEKVAPQYTDGKASGADDLARIREARALSRGAAAALHQPTVPFGGRGQRASGTTPIKDVGTLSDAEFAKIPEAEKKRLRGD